MFHHGQCILRRLRSLHAEERRQLVHSLRHWVLLRPFIRRLLRHRRRSRRGPCDWPDCWSYAFNNSMRLVLQVLLLSTKASAYSDCAQMIYDNNHLISATSGGPPSTQYNCMIVALSYPNPLRHAPSERCAHFWTPQQQKPVTAGSIYLACTNYFQLKFSQSERRAPIDCFLLLLR